MSEQKNKLSLADFEKIETNKDLLNILESKKISFQKVQKRILYNEELRLLQIELVKLQQWVSKNKKRYY